MVDRISNLPDSIIHRIYSFLPTQNYVQSSVFSKRWRNRWCSAPSLSFDLNQFRVPFGFGKTNKPSIIPRFFEFVDAVLQRHDGSDVENFHVHWDTCISFCHCCLHAWVIFAIRHNVQVLKLDIGCIDENQQNLSMLPSHVFTSGSLKELTLNWKGYLHFPDSMRLSALKVLDMVSVKFTQDEYLFQKFLSACPMLETLTLEDCVFDDYRLITINAPNLKSLYIHDGFLGSRTKGPCTIIITAPSLIKFTLYFDFSHEDDRYVLNFPPVHASIILGSHDNSSRGVPEILREISNAHTLELYDVLLQENLLRVLSSFTVIKHLKVTPRNRKSIIPWIVTVLRVCPSIEALSMNLYGVDFFKPPFWNREQEGYFPTLYNLKSVVLHHCNGHPQQAEFVKLLLEKGVVLQKMVISSVVNKGSYQERLSKNLCEAIFKHLNASLDVGITFKSIFL